jgi:hypothetical protein
MTTKTTVTAPVINLNGTNGEALLKEYRTAIGAVNTAYIALDNITVHGRDFQTAAPGLYAQAREEQINRLKALAQIKEELLALYAAVDDQLIERKRTRGEALDNIIATWAGL